jgi:hypothetical protein
MSTRGEVFEQGDFLRADPRGEGGSQASQGTYG